MADREIAIVITGKNLSGEAFKEVNSQLKGMEEATKKTSGALDVAFGVLASTQFKAFSDLVGRMFKPMIEQASEAQAINAQLERVIQSTGMAAGISADEVRELAEQFADLTVYEDDAIVGAQTLLLQFDNINQANLSQATEVMTDLATRMKTDLPTAAKTLGKALEGRLRGLASYGIVIDEGIQKNIDNLLAEGKTAEATQTILDEISSRVGGAAEAQAASFEGLVLRIKKSKDDLAEILGTALVENQKVQGALSWYEQTLRNLGTTFKNLPESAQLGIGGLIGAVALLGQAAPGLISLKILLEGFSQTALYTRIAKNFSFLSAIIRGTLLRGLGEVGKTALFAALASKFSFLSAVIHGTLLRALGGLAGVLAGISAPVWLLVSAIAALIAVIVLLGPKAKETFLMIADIIAAVLKRAGYEISTFLKKTVLSLKLPEIQLAEIKLPKVKMPTVGGGGLAAGALNIVPAPLIEAARGRLARLGDQINRIKTNLQGVGQAAVTAFQNLRVGLENLPILLQNFIVLLQSSLPTWEQLDQAAQTVFTNITTLWNSFARVIGEALNNALSYLRRWMSTVYSQFRSWASGLMSYVGNLFRSVGTGLVNGIRDGIASGWEGLKTWISGSLDSLLAWVKTKLGIQSPSEVFAREIGLPLAEGIGEGLRLGMGSVRQVLRDLSMPQMQFAPVTAGFVPASAGARYMQPSSGTFTRIAVGRIEIHNPLTQDERYWVRKQSEQIAERSLERILR